MYGFVFAGSGFFRLFLLGRWTVRGSNGAGKSTLLSKIKETIGDKAFLLPTHYEDLHFASSFLQHSDGNRLHSVFRQLIDLVHVKYILLDEWDANLDEHNLILVNDILEELAKTKVILESRHRI